MSNEKKFDANLKDLIDQDPNEWGRFLATRLGMNATEFEILKPEDNQFAVIESDVSTALQTDKLFKPSKDAYRLIHLELEASRESGLPQRVHTYNVLAARHHKRIVRSEVLLLRRESKLKDVTGVYIVRDETVPLPPPGEHDPSLIHYFQYHVICLWEISLDELIPFGLTLLPLALLTKEGKENIEATYQKAEDQLRKANISDKMKLDLVTMMINIGGLVHDESALRSLYMSIGNILEESWIFQDIKGKGHVEGLAEGREEGRVEGREEGRAEMVIESIIRLGTKRFGKPESSIQDQILRTSDVHQLQEMLDNVLTANSWDDIVKT